MRLGPLLLATLAAGLVAATPVATSAQTRLPLDMPADGVEALSARLDHREGLYLFDSGLGTSAVTPGTAGEIGCHPWGKVTGFRAIGERVDAERCNAAMLEIGAYRRRMPQLSVFDLEQFMGPLGRRFAGAIGLDAFDGQVVTLSVAHHTLTIEDANSLSCIVQTAREVPIRLVRAAEGAALTADVGVPTARGLLWFEIDTGNDGPSLIDTRAASLLALDAGDEPQPLAARIASDIQFDGTAVVRDLIMDGDLGREALKDWDITIDLAHGRGWIRPAGVHAPG